MAVVPISSICQNCQDKVVDVIDETGAYNIETNPTGWGSPNPAIGDVQSAYARVTLSNGEVYIIDVSGTLPNLTETPFRITNEMLGLEPTEQLPDGVQLIEVVYSGISGGVPFTVQSSQQVLFSCNAQCCVDKKMSGAGGGCACKSGTEAIDLAVMLESAKSAATCGKPEKAQVLIDKINEICGHDCGCS